MNIKALRPNIVFLIIGVLLLIISYLIKSQLEFFSSTLMNISFILLTIVIVDFFWEVLGGEPISQTLNELRVSVKLLEDSHSSGLNSLLAVSGEFGNHGDWMNRLKLAKRFVDLQGYTLHMWNRCENFEQEIIELVRKGVRVRVLFMDNENPNIEGLINSNQIRSITVAAVKDEIKIVKNVFENIHNNIERIASSSGGKLSGSFEVKSLCKGLIVCQICRTDSEMTVVNYLFSVVASQSPLMLIKGQDTKLFKAYMREFDQLWELGSSILSTNTQNQ